MSMLGTLSSVEGQACLGVFKDLPTRTDESSMKEGRSSNKTFHFHFSVFLSLLKNRSLASMRVYVQFCAGINIIHLYRLFYGVSVSLKGSNNKDLAPV